MKHAGGTTLKTLAPLLARLRALPGMVERSPGCFYRGSKSFLHFHEDASGTHADVRLLPPEFTRMRVESEAERDALMVALARTLQSPRCRGSGALVRAEQGPQPPQLRLQVEDQRRGVQVRAEVALQAAGGEGALQVGTAEVPALGRLIGRVDVQDLHLDEAQHPGVVGADGARQFAHGEGRRVDGGGGDGAHVNLRGAGAG
jgi:hypothetical protein